jgi:hypothetical protein
MSIVIQLFVKIVLNLAGKKSYLSRNQAYYWGGDIAQYQMGLRISYSRCANQTFIGSTNR